MPAFKKLLLDAGVDVAIAERLVRFRDLVVQESKTQNLTKILEPQDFFEGHIVDCLELVKAEWISAGDKLMDLGSGAGIPGIPFHLLTRVSVVLVESEKRKSEFLERAVAQLELDGVSVYYGRAEASLKDHQFDAVLVRAVGSLEKLLDLVRKSSTWNRLILFKGPAFAEEKKVLSYGKNKRFKVGREHTYRVGDKTRILVEITQVKE